MEVITPDRTTILELTVCINFAFLYYFFRFSATESIL